MGKWVLRIFVLLVVAFVVASFALPPELQVEEAITIPAPAEAVRPFISDFRRWPEWTEFNSKNDASVQWTYSGSPTGAGSVAEWKGKDLGSGKLEMVEDDPRFGTHFRVTSKSHIPAEGRIVLETASNGTVVTWTMKEYVAPMLRLLTIGTRAAIHDELHQQLTKLSEVVTARKQ